MTCYLELKSFAFRDLGQDYDTVKAAALRLLLRPGDHSREESQQIEDTQARYVHGGLSFLSYDSGFGMLADLLERWRIR